MWNTSKNLFRTSSNRWNHRNRLPCTTNVSHFDQCDKRVIVMYAALKYPTGSGYQSPCHLTRQDGDLRAVLNHVVILDSSRVLPVCWESENGLKVSRSWFFLIYLVYLGIQGHFWCTNVWVAVRQIDGSPVGLIFSWVSEWIGGSKARQ